MTDAERKAIRTAQRAYLDADAGTGSWADYNAHVDTVTYALGITHEEAYRLVEDGEMV
jgi:hypothetical protein